MSRTIVKPEIEATANDGTKYRVRYHKQRQEYLVEARNDRVGYNECRAFGARLVKRAWVEAFSDPDYSGALSCLFDELREYNAKAGEL